MFHSAKETDVKGTSLHRGHRWNPRAPPYKEDGHRERREKTRGAAPSWCSKILPALLWLPSKQTETGLRQKHWLSLLWFWSGVWLFIVSTIPTSFPSVYSHTSGFASKLLHIGRIQKCFSQVKELWFRHLNYETGCPDSLFLFCRGLVSLWLSLFVF